MAGGAAALRRRSAPGQIGAAGAQRRAAAAPYETRETLDRLADEIARLDPATVLCLGDSFDDDRCSDGLDDDVVARLTTLQAGRDSIWLAGNHDPGPVALGGRHLAEMRTGMLTFRHQAEASAPPGEVSGHFHPKLRLSLRGHALSRPCFLLDARRLILPAFGAFTGGLAADHPALTALFDPPACAVLTGAPCLTVPLPLDARRGRRAG